MDNQDKDYGRLENLQVKINEFRQESVDVGFSKYLDTIQARLDNQMVQAINLENELNQNYQVYLQHFGAQVKPVMANQEPSTQQPAVTQRAAEVLPQQMPMQPIQEQQMYQQSVRPKKSVEFTIGTGVFCVLGVLFILAAFVMLGMTYMGGLFKGLCLYAMAGVVILISEFVFKKRMEQFSLGLTGLGIAGFYVSTIVNYMYLHNFGNIVAILLTVLISVFAAIMARKKDSGIIKVISFIGCYACFLPAGKTASIAEFLSMSVILLFINIFTLLLPVKRRARAVHITHLLSNMVMTIALAGIALGEEQIDVRWIVGFVVSNLIVLSLVYYFSWRKGQCSIGVFVNFLVAFAVESLYFALILMPAIHSKIYDEFALSKMWYHIMFGTYGLALVGMFLLFIKNRYKWNFYYFLLSTVLFTYGMAFFDNSATLKLAVILGVFVISKILSRVKLLKASEVVIAVITLCYALYAYTEGDEWAHVYALTILASAVALKHYKIFYQYFITVSSMLYLWLVFGDFQLLPALMAGVLFLLLFAFNNVKWWRAKNPFIYNIGAGILLLGTALLTPIIAGYLNTVLVALFGTAMMILMFTDKYEMNYKGKYLTMVLFWSYIVFAIDFEMEIVSSVLLMVIAIVSVIMGFWLERKEVRVYGLIASLMVCFKVLFYDFSDTPIQERMLLFLLVGVIILSISFIYILLEKKIANRGE